MGPFNPHYRMPKPRRRRLVSIRFWMSWRSPAIEVKCWRSSLVETVETAKTTPPSVPHGSTWFHYVPAEMPRLLPGFEALEKELKEVEGGCMWVLCRYGVIMWSTRSTYCETMHTSWRPSVTWGLEIITPPKHAEWGSITKACKDLEDDHAQVRKNLTLAQNPKRYQHNIQDTLWINQIWHVESCSIRPFLPPLVGHPGSAQETDEWTWSAKDFRGPHQPAVSLKHRSSIMKSVGPLEPAWSSTFQQPRTETLQKHTSCVTEQLPVGLSELWKAWPMENLAAKVGEDAPHLKAIRNRCKQVSIGAFFFLFQLVGWVFGEKSA